MEDSAVDVEKEFLCLAGTRKGVAVSARGPLDNIPCSDYVPEISISLIETTNTATRRVSFGKLAH